MVRMIQITCLLLWVCPGTISLWRANQLYRYCNFKPHLYSNYLSKCDHFQKYPKDSILPNEKLLAKVGVEKEKRQLVMQCISGLILYSTIYKNLHVAKIICKYLAFIWYKIWNAGSHTIIQTCLKLTILDWQSDGIINMSHQAWLMVIHVYILLTKYSTLECILIGLLKYMWMHI